MYRAQGTQPEPHQLLQVHPAAPAALIADVYLALSQRYAARRPADEAYLGALHAAYRQVMSARGQRDPERTATPGCHYTALCLDPSADTGIVQLAYDTLERIDPLPHDSLARYLRREAFRVLSNPMLRARYDGVRPAATLAAPGRVSRAPAATPVTPPRKDEPVTTTRKRGLFGLGRSRPADVDPVDARILDLRSRLPIAQEEEEPSGQAPSEGEASLPVAEIVFIAGTHAGMRVELAGNVVPMGEGKSSATIWRHGERFLLRHNGKRVTVSDKPPLLPIVVLEDGDEIGVGADRARFRVIPPAIG